MSWPVALVLAVFILSVSFTVVAFIAILNIFKSPLKSINWQEMERENEDKSDEISNEVEEFYQQYKKEVNNSNLGNEEKKNYLSYTGYFVSWLSDDFEIEDE